MNRCCPSRLRKRDEYQSSDNSSIYAYQFMGQFDELTNEQKDKAILNKGILNENSMYGQAFHGKILPPSKRFGPFEYQMSNGTYVNPYRYSNDVCFGIGECREYADQLERYMKCREQCDRQGIDNIRKKCGPPPQPPKQFASFASFVFPWN